MTRSIVGRTPGRFTPKVKGRVRIPPSKSHTIRALLIAALADGESRIRRPLKSLDSLSCKTAVCKFGASVKDDGENWVVKGSGPVPQPEGGVIDVGNSGTTLYLATALAALADVPVSFDGDDQIRRRSAAPLLGALEELGAKIQTAAEGCVPYTVTGPLSAGTLTVDCPVSQYLSALLLTAPLIRTKGQRRITDIHVPHLNEASYVGITLDWLDRQGIRYEREGWKQFRIAGGQSFKPFDRMIPADWSSAAPFLAAAAVTGGSLFLEGLDREDSQGDKAVAGMFEAMGCVVEETDKGLKFEGRPLTAVELDLNDTPDALPVLAAAACFADGETRLVNVPQARLKETDRIMVMTKELRRLGADVEELPEGLRIRGRHPSDDGFRLVGAPVDGHGDHRVVMALAMAALGCRGEVSIRGAEAVEVTFPDFFTLFDEIRTEA